MAMASTSTPKISTNITANSKMASPTATERFIKMLPTSRNRNQTQLIYLLFTRANGETV